MPSPSVCLAGTVLAASALLAGCWGPTPSQMVESGRARMQKGEYKAAAIEFKNALQKDATLVDARFWLGKALLESGDANGAWVELSKAKEGGYSNDELVPVMAAALILRGEGNKFIADYADAKLTDPKRQAELKAALATAYGAQGKYVQARAAADAALQADPNNLIAQLSIVQLLAVTGDKAGAMEEVDKALKAHPEASRPWVSKAELLQATNADPAQVMLAYREALKRRNDDFQAHIGVVRLLMAQRDFEGVDKQLAEMAKQQPNNPLVMYYTASAAFERHDLKKAFELSQQLLKMAPHNPMFLYQAGLIEYERGGYLQAVAHLGKALPNSPNPVPVRIMMARAQLRAGDARKALSFVSPLLENDKLATSEAYAVAADASLQMGDGEAAKRLYAKAVKLNPGNMKGRTALAVAEMMGGQTEKALDELKSVANQDAGVEADVAMTMSLLRRNRLDEAAAAIEAMDKKLPGKPVAPLLRGRLEQLLNHRDKAREQYEEALRRFPSYMAAATTLAAMDYEDNKPAAAVARFEKVVAADPQSLDGAIALISARTRAGARPEEIRSQLEAVIKRFPDQELPRLALITHLMEAGENKLAVQAANETAARFTDSPKALEALGLAELSVGNLNQASQAFSKMLALRPNSADAMMRMVDLHDARKDVPAAIAQLRKVLAVKPDHLQAQMRLITLLARNGKMDEAMAIAKSAQTQSPNEPQGWSFEGDVQAAKRNWPAAVAAFRTSLSKRPLEETVIKLYLTLASAGQQADADKLAVDWLAKHPESPALDYLLGDQAMARGDFDKSEQHFRKVLAVRPGNAVALNNLAWLLHRAGRPGAQETIDKAMALAPNSPALTDTAAEIQAGAGHLDKALALQRRAVELDPEQPLHRLHLAEYLIKNNQKAEAKGELQKLADLGKSFGRAADVQKLLSTL
ncbi:XrtA/PEP-CTERM system TPR-repeat protein PrsT [Roseateles sp. NT4]|uniref:XrtA/PEP-CTERM system TPR-repeat protein PrsT n=1 Tax=Roseateles sp. NT4 TaxID=3453715 RepID=UPI003EEA9820